MEYMCMCVLSLSALISDSWHQKIFQVTLSYVANQPHCHLGISVRSVSVQGPIYLLLIDSIIFIFLYNPLIFYFTGEQFLNELASFDNIFKFPSPIHL